RRPDNHAAVALDGRPDPAVRRRDAGAGAPGQAAGLQAAPEVVPELPPRPGAAGVALGGAGPRRAPAAVAAARPPHEVPAPADAGRDGVPVRPRRACPVALPPRAPLHPDVPRRAAERDLRTGRVAVGGVRRQLELARPGLVPGQLPADRVAPE